MFEWLDSTIYHVNMNRKPYIIYRFTRRAIEHLVGECRPTIAYHIKRLKDIGVIEPKMYTKADVGHLENGRIVYRTMEVLDIFAVKAIARSFDTIRARSVYDRCVDIIAKNKRNDLLHFHYTYVDYQVLIQPELCQKWTQKRLSSS